MRALIVAPVALALLVLSGCTGLFGGSRDPQNVAFDYCAEQVAATFDDPEAVEVAQYEGGHAGAADTYEFTSTVTAEGTTYDLSCTVTGTEGSFVLESYELTEK
jgi:hypothetical protein